MSTIKDELKKVRPLPLIQRAWLYVKDHPNVTPATVASALKEAANNVSGVLGLACQRGMLTRVAVRDRRVKGQPFAYTAPYHMTEYELLPMPKATNGRPASVLDITPPKPPDLATVRKAEISAVIDTLTIAEARVLYQTLHKMFK